MTPRERAKQLVEPEGIITTANGYPAAAMSAIEYAIIAAVEEEREACAKAAEEAGPTFYHKDMREAATSIAATIRARGGKK